MKLYSGWRGAQAVLKMSPLAAAARLAVARGRVYGRTRVGGVRPAAADLILFTLCPCTSVERLLHCGRRNSSRNRVRKMDRPHSLLNFQNFPVSREIPGARSASLVTGEIPGQKRPETVAQFHSQAGCADLRRGRLRYPAVSDGYSTSSVNPT